MTAVEEKTDAMGLAMTELDERLRGPEGKALATRILGRFDKLINDLERSKAQGLTPAEFAATETLLKAVAAAKQTMLAFTMFQQAASNDEGVDAKEKYASPEFVNFTGDC